MKYVTLFIISFLCFSCASHYPDYPENAFDEVARKISYTEKQYERFERNKSADFSEVNDLVNLSLITPDIYSTDSFGIHFIPSHQDISEWKQWLEENRIFFSYYDNEDVNKLYFFDERKIIMIEYEPDKFRYSISNYKLDYLKHAVEVIKENSVKKEKESN